MQSVASWQPFALAKLQPPRPRTPLIGRPALEAALHDALLQRRLTLLLAPAGYGKTVALARQLDGLPAGCAQAWISADDDPLQRFLACLTAALDPLDLPWRVAPEALAVLAASEGGLAAAASAIVNALAGAAVTRGLIVIDDLHRITDPAVYALLARLLERWPEHWGLVLASRVEPPLPLARLRAAGELAEFGVHELSFGAAEVAALLAQRGGAAAPAQAQELLQRTGGWAAGLRLSLSAGVAGHAAPQLTQRHLFDYLAAEVFDQLPPALRSFLLRSSVLHELSATRCARVTGEPGSARLLDDLERRGLFVSALDGPELTLRLHDLFRDFLQDRLAREQPDELPLLLRRAAAEETDLARAVHDLARAGDWDEAARRLGQGASDLMMAGAVTELERLLALVPPAQAAGQPDLQLLRGLVAFTRYDWDLLLEATTRAAEGYAAAGRARDEAVARAYACAGLHHAGRKAEATQELARLRALALDDAARAVVLYISAWDAFAGDRVDEIVAALAAMLDSLERLPDIRLWLQCANLSLLVGLPGLEPVFERFIAGVARVAGDEPTALRAAVMHLRCLQAVDAGKLEEAAAWLRKADDDCRWLGQPRLLATDNAFAHLAVHALRGEVALCAAASEAAWQDMLQHSPPSHRRVHQVMVQVARQRAAWVLQDDAAVRGIQQEMARCAHPDEWADAPRHRALGAAFVALLDGDLLAARALLRPLALGGERFGYFMSAQARCLLADVACRLGDPDEAAALLQPLLVAAQRGHGVGGALFAGRAVLARLAAFEWAGRLGEEDLALLRWLPARQGHGEPAVPARPAADASGLSAREREVLERMAAGDSNKLIARAFDLSPHTVKRHVANILDKLALGSRGQAAAWWQAQQARRGGPGG